MNFTSTTQIFRAYVVRVVLMRGAWRALAPAHVTFRCQVLVGILTRAPLVLWI